MKRHRVSTCLTLVGALVLGERLAHAADPTTADCLAASDASLKSGNEHKLRSERSQLLTCAAASCPTDIRKDCMSRVEELNLQIPTVIFAAKDAAGADLSAVRVTMDGEVLTTRLEGTPLSIDPGNHAFVFETQGQAPVTRSLVIQQAQKERREIVRFGPVPAPEPPPLPPPASDTSHGLGTQRVLALVAGSVGVVGIGLGTAFGVLATSQKSDAEARCPRNPCPTQAGVDEWSSAGSSGTVATAFFVVGGLGLAGGVALWLTAPKMRESTQVGIGPGAVTLRGTF